MAEESRYKLRAMVRSFWHPSPWDGVSQSGSDPRVVCGEGIPGPSLAHPAQNRQEVLPGAWSAEYGFSSTKPMKS